MNTLTTDAAEVTVARIAARGTTVTACQVAAVLLDVADQLRQVTGTEEFRTAVEAQPDEESYRAGFVAAVDLINRAARVHEGR